jgi:hypothetical protein
VENLNRGETAAVLEELLDLEDGGNGCLKILVPTYVSTKEPAVSSNLNMEEARSFETSELIYQNILLR